MKQTDIINEKVNHIKNTINALRRERAKLLTFAESAEKKTGVAAWFGHQFESSSVLTEEWAAFARQFRAELKKNIAGMFELVGFTRGHFFLSGFVKRKVNGKLAYFSTNDVRYNGSGWYSNILVREAKHEKDYTGGSNDWVRYDELVGKFQELTQIITADDLPF